MKDTEIESNTRPSHARAMEGHLPDSWTPHSMYAAHWYCGNTVPAIKNAPVNKNAPLFSSIYRYVSKGLEVFFSSGIIFLYVWFTGFRKKSFENVNFEACFIERNCLTVIFSSISLIKLWKIFFKRSCFPIKVSYSYC